MLTNEELKAIERDALAYNCSPYGNPNPVTYGYIKGATSERIKAKKLLEALQEILDKPDSVKHFYEMKQTANDAISEYNTKQIEP